MEQNHSLIKDKDQESQNENWIGELFFMLNLLAVHLGVDTEKALRSTNRKFEYEVKEFEKGIKLIDQKKDELKKNLTGSLKGLFK